MKPNFSLFITIISLICWIGCNAEPSTTACSGAIPLRDDSILNTFTIAGGASSIAFKLNYTRRSNDYLNVKVFAAEGAPKLGIYAAAVPTCPSPPRYPGYSACCSAVEENQLRTNQDYYVVIVPSSTSETPVSFQIQVCADVLNCPDICPKGCSHNGWCNTTSKACTCDEGYIGKDCATCPGCGPASTKLFLGVFASLGVAVFVVGVIPVIAIVAIITAVCFFRRKPFYQPLPQGGVVYTSPVLINSNGRIIDGHIIGISPNLRPLSISQSVMPMHQPAHGHGNGNGNGHGNGQAGFSPAMPSLSLSQTLPPGYSPVLRPLSSSQVLYAVPNLTKLD